MPCAHLRAALARAIGIGHDTDTVAAIAGALLGARWGASAVPAEWLRVLHGYPGLTGERLVELATLAAGRGPDRQGWPGVDRLDYGVHLGGEPVLVQHPLDDGVWLGDIRALGALSPGADAVVSLCRMGRAEVPDGVESVVFRLIDSVDPAANPNLAFVLKDAAETVRALRAQGRGVLRHRVAAQSRTPAVAAAYALLLGHGESGVNAKLAALPSQQMNSAFRRALEEMSASGW
jgi:hypothetical protein